MLIQRAGACVLGLAGGFAMVSAAQAQTPLKVELCLALDSSDSIARDDWELQIDAYRAALLNKDVVPQNGTVAISIVAFSSDARLVQEQITVTQDTAKAGGTIDMALLNWRYGQLKEQTAIGAAIALCTSTFSKNTSTRKVIDVSTDGAHNMEDPTPQDAADAAVAAGVDVINLLGVGNLINGTELEETARPQPAGALGEGDGFVTIASGWSVFQTALEQKIAIELAPPALTVTKNNGIDAIEFVPGAEVRTSYTVTITNHGEAAAEGVSWSDAPVGLTVESIRTDTAVGVGSVLGTCTTSGCEGITVAGGGSVSYQVIALVTGEPGTYAENTATVTGGGCEGQAFCRATDRDLIRAPLTPAQLTVTKDNGVGALTPGAITKYTVTITNQGQTAAENVSWSDTFAGLDVTGIVFGTPVGDGSTLGTCTVVGGAGCSGITVAGGGSVSYLVEAVVTGEVGSEAENTATVMGGGCDGQPYCTATDTDPIVAVVPVVPAQVTPVPTLAEWGLILLAGLMAGLTWLTRRRHMG